MAWLIMSVVPDYIIRSSKRYGKKYAGPSFPIPEQNSPCNKACKVPRQLASGSAERTVPSSASKATLKTQRIWKHMALPTPPAKAVMPRSTE